MHPVGVAKIMSFEILLASLGVPCSVELFMMFYKVYKSGDWFTVEQRERHKDWKLISKPPSNVKNWRFDYLFVDTFIHIWMTSLFSWKTELSRELNEPPYISPSLKEVYDRMHNTSVPFRLCEERMLVLAGISQNWEAGMVLVIMHESLRKRMFLSLWPCVLVYIYVYTYVLCLCM